MTLLFAYIDDNYVMQVSDERVSLWNPTSRAWDIRDDETVKQVFIRGSLILTFTGVVDLDGGVPTSDWLAREFSKTEGDLDHVVSAIAERLTSIFTRLRYRGQSLVVLIAGWVETAGGELRPIFGHISNQHPHTFERLAKFESLVGTLEPGPHWVTRGQPLPSAVETALRRNINAALSAGISPPVLQRLLLGAMRSTAACNRLVGPSAQVGVLPRAAIERAQADPSFLWVWENKEAAFIPGAAMFVRVPEGEDRTVSIRPVVV